MKKFLFFLMTFCLLTSMAYAQDTIKIGLMAPLTGSFASEGAEMKQVLELLADELNAKGGLLGKKVELITDDDGGDARTAALAAQTAHDKGRRWPSSAPTAPPSPRPPRTSSTRPRSSRSPTAPRPSGSPRKGLKYFFRTCPRDDEQGKVAAGRHRENQGEESGHPPRQQHLRQGTGR